MDFRDSKSKMDLVRVLTRQYHFLIFKKNFSRNTPPLFAKLVYCPWKNPEANMSIVSLPRNLRGPSTCGADRVYNCKDICQLFAQIIHKSKTSKKFPKRTKNFQQHLSSHLSIKKIKKFFKNLLTNRSICDIIDTERRKEVNTNDS